MKKKRYQLAGARGEAAFCLRLLEKGESVEQIRRLIGVSESQARELRQIAGEFVTGIAVHARIEVGREFENLLKARNEQANRPQET